MADDQRVLPRALAKSADAPLRHMSVKAIAPVFTHQQTSSDAFVTRLNALADTFVADSADARHVMIARMREDGLDTPGLIDHVIPEVARILGQRWHDDTLSFADVTIGSARLQETVRAVVARELSSSVGGLNTTYRRLKTAKAQRVMLLIPRPEQHTLGTFIAADQFRRLGFEVDVLVDSHPQQVASALRKTRYVMIGITISGRRTLTAARELVDTIRAMLTRAIPIVLGGSYIGIGRELRETTGVDHVVTGAMHALKICGLNIVELDPPYQAVASLP